MCVTIATEAYTLVSLVPWIAESSFSVVNVVGWVLRVSIVHWDAVTGFVATPFAATMTAGYLCAPMVVDVFAPAILRLSGTVRVFCRGGGCDTGANQEIWACYCCPPCCLVGRRRLYLLTCFYLDDGFSFHVEPVFLLAQFLPGEL